MANRKMVIPLPPTSASNFFGTFEKPQVRTHSRVFHTVHQVPNPRPKAGLLLK